MFTSPAVVCPYLCSTPVFAYTNGIYAASDIYFISAHTGRNVDLALLAAYLNSRAAHVWMGDHAPRKGGQFMCTSSTLALLPVKV